MTMDKQATAKAPAKKLGKEDTAYNIAAKPGNKAFAAFNQLRELLKPI